MIYYVNNSPLLFPSPDIALATVDDALEYFKNHRAVQVDTETTGLNFLTDRILTLQLGDKKNQYVINAEVGLERFKTILEDLKVVKLGQNVKFDYKFLRRAGITMENVWDTFLAEQVIHTGKETIKFSLQDIVLRYIEVYLEKDVRESFINSNGVMTDKQIIYAAKDVTHLEDVCKEQQKLIKEYGLKNAVRLENRVVLALADIEYNGMAINPEAWLKNSQSALEALRKLELEMDAIAVNEEVFGMKGNGYQLDMFKTAEETRKTSVNWNSSTQVLRLFKRVLPELESVGGDVLYPFRSKHKLILMYLTYKKKQKLYTSYGPNFLNLLGPDGRIHTDFRQILNTGRISSSNPNMQQIPSTDDYRNCFIPGIKDWVFVSSDFSSQELAIIAYGSGDPVWLDALQNHYDLHSICAELLFGKKWKKAATSDCAFYNRNKQKCDCPEHKKLRTFAKTLNFGLSYGMSAFKLSDRVEIPIEEAEALIKKFFSVFPRIKYFLDSLGNYGKKNGHIKTFPPFSRIRWFENWNDSLGYKELGEIERASKNTPIQGSGADMVKLAMVYIREFINKNKVPVKMVMNVHDQVDTIVHKDYAQEWSRELENLMELAALKIVKNGLLKSETSINEVWKK